MSIISKELLSEVLGVYVKDGWYFDCELLIYTYDKILGLDENYHSQINIYELVHMNLKQWAKFKNVFGKIDWSEEPEQIFKKAEELRNEIS